MVFSEGTNFLILSNLNVIYNYNEPLVKHVLLQNIYTSYLFSRLFYNIIS